MPKIKLKTPNSLVLDIYGVITSHEFKDQLKQFANDNLTIYINENFGNRRFIKLVNRLIKENVELNKLYSNTPEIDENFNLVPDEELDSVKKQIEKLIRFRIEKKYYGDTILFIYEDIWFKGFKDGKLKSHVYDEVYSVLNDWRMNKFIKIYTLASAAGQHLFLSNTVSGDLNSLIANCMDPSTFGKEDKKCFIAISLALRSDPDKLIYLTDNVKRMKVAKEVKFQVILVKRSDNNIEIDSDIVKDTPIISNLNDIEFIDDNNQVKDCC